MCRTLFVKYFLRKKFFVRIIRVQIYLIPIIFYVVLNKLRFNRRVTGYNPMGRPPVYFNFFGRLQITHNTPKVRRKEEHG